MTTEQTIIRRAGVVAEILATRHDGHDQLPLAINRARNAVFAGLSAHAALERGEQWIRAAERVQGRPRTTLADPQHDGTSPARPICPAQRAEAARHLRSIERSREYWWEECAEQHLIDAIRENLDAKPAERQRMIDAMRTKDDAEIGRLVRENVEPYLDHECDRAHDPEA